MKNNFVKLVGNVCGHAKLLRDKTEEKVCKAEFIFIPNDRWDDIGKPNSIRIHSFGSMAEKVLETVKNGDKLALKCHLKRIASPGCTETDPVRYGVEIIIDSFEIIQRSSSINNTDNVLV